jgi:hypothetical protein
MEVPTIGVLVNQPRVVKPPRTATKPPINIPKVEKVPTFDDP